MFSYQLCAWFPLSSTDISRLKVLKGLALQDIITQIHTYIHRGIAQIHNLR